MPDDPVSTRWNLDAVPTFARGPYASVVKIDTPGGKGTGWVLGKSLVVTNQHVVAKVNARDIRIALPDGGHRQVKKVCASDPVADLAVLRTTTALQLEALAISQRPIEVTAQVYALGYPFAYDGPAPLFTVGHVAGVNSLVVRGEPRERLVLNAAINPGNSGGPVFAWGNSIVVGVVATKLSPMPRELREKIEVLAAHKSGVSFQVMQNGHPRRMVEAELVAEILEHFRETSQVVIGEAVPAATLARFLTANEISYTAHE